MLDDWIHEALWEDALAQPPQEAWDRARMILERRRCRRKGMWVLEEPLRDPPDTLPMLLSLEQSMRAHRLYIERRYNLSFYLIMNAFNNLFPTFSALINY
ncbi:MAG: hypothetical protein K8S97_08140 [Anaerolineae bacterium]|nr:hypothetical protein [Anaerolineae bacterium]